MFDVEKIRADFPVLKRRVYDKPLVYLDSSATTLKPKTVIGAVRNYFENSTASVHRSVHKMGEEATAAFESTRDKIQKYINASDRKEIIFTSGVTQAINLVAYSYGRSFLKEGDEILLSGMEHHSGIVPWQILATEKGCKIKAIPILDDGSLDMDEYAKLLSPKVKLVASVYVSNSLGTVNPIKRMTEMAHEVGAVVLVDGAQAMLHKRVDVADLNCDFFAISGHKMLGPTGCGVLYGKRELLEKMPPFIGGGDMIRSVSFEGTTFADLPSKFEAGTPPIAEFIGLGAAFDYLSATNFDELEAHEQSLLDHGEKVLGDVPGIKFIGQAKGKSSIISFVLDGIHPHDIGTLVDQSGVAIRTGHHCTQPVMKHFKIPATARASLSLYNTKSDLDALAGALNKAREVFA